MRFPDYFKEGNGPVVTFEVFPPKTPRGMRSLERRILPELVEHNPRCITVTYGAMGTTQDKTLDIAAMIRERFGVDSAHHLTCVGASRGEIEQIVARIREAGITNIVALRGDPPGGNDRFEPPPGGFEHANQLVSHIRTIEASDAPFGIAVGGYPEKHLEAENLTSDLVNLKRKVDAGADIVITQLFYDNASYFRFRDAAYTAGITIPIIPGLMPIQSAGQIQRITTMCGASIPSDLQIQLDRAGDDDARAEEIGIEKCIAQTAELIAASVPGIHFYVLNRSRHMGEILDAVSL